MTVYTVYFSFIMFVLLLLLVNSYFLISLKIEKNKEAKIARRKVEIKQHFINIFDRQDKDKDQEIKLLKDNFDRKVDIKAFYLAVKEYYRECDNKKDMILLLEDIVDIDKILKSGIVRKEYKESYALYLISEFGLGNEEAGSFALSALEEDSVYVRNNALKVINKNKDLELVMKSMDKLNARKYYFNEKMIVDFLDNYNGDCDQLSKRLLLEMDNYNLSLKKIVITHFANIKDPSQNVRDKMLSFLEKSNEKEIIIASSKYFNRIIDKRAKLYILKNMQNEDWAVRAVSARIIYKYGDSEVKEALKKALRDENYYVRANSASSFLEIEDKDKIIEEALRSEDKFARDILLYSMNTQEIISFEEYQALVEKIEDTKVMEGAALI